MSDILIIVNFFFLALALLFVYYYSVQLRLALNKAREQHLMAEKFRALFNKTVEGVVQTDTEGIVTLVNDAGAKIVGYTSADEMLKESVHIGQFYLYPEQINEVREGIFNGGLKDFRLDIKTRHGVPAVISMTFHPILDEANHVIGMEGIFRDVTDRVRIEKQLQEYNENLEAKVKAKAYEVLALERKKFDLEKLAAVGQMASTLVHELRNPLSSIKMGLTTLVRRAVLLDQDKHILDVSIREVTHLERIMKDILDFARPQKLQFVQQPVNPVIQTAIDRMAESCQEANITIGSEIAEDLPPIALDADKMIQVLVNLLMNSKDALDPGGHVTVRSSFIPDGNLVRIEVEDTGRGIPADAIGHLFEPFYSRKSGGTGLGLTVVEKFVNVHGGKVNIESEEGKGTLIRIELPVNSEPLSEAPAV